MAAPTDPLLAILQDFFNPAEEGWLWLALYDDDAERKIVEQIEGSFDDAAQAAQALGDLINGVPPERAWLAICRSEGRPYESDRELWRRLRAAVTPGKLVDMVAFNARIVWSMREEDVAASRAAG
jgi:hypothetical protein